jgi:hypothetical protein
MPLALVILNNIESTFNIYYPLITGVNLQQRILIFFLFTRESINKCLKLFISMVRFAMVAVECYSLLGELH